MPCCVTASDLLEALIETGSVLGCKTLRTAPKLCSGALRLACVCFAFAAAPEPFRRGVSRGVSETVRQPKMQQVRLRVGQGLRVLALAAALKSSKARTSCSFSVCSTSVLNLCPFVQGLRMFASAAAPEPTKGGAPAAVSACATTSLVTCPFVQGLRVFASAAAPEPSKAERQVWFPGNKAPDYLDGSMPGDFGFDPLGLGSDPNTLRWCAAKTVEFVDVWLLLLL